MKKYRPKSGGFLQTWCNKWDALCKVIMNNNLDKCVLPDSARVIMRIRHGLM